MRLPLGSGCRRQAERKAYGKTKPLVSRHNKALQAAGPEGLISLTGASVHVPIRNSLRKPCALMVWLAIVYLKVASLWFV